MALYATWKISDDEEYKLKLRASEIIALEDKLGGGNLLGQIGSNRTGIPGLKTMLTITHAAAQKYQHGVTMKDICEAFDRYTDNGGDQVTFFTDVYTKIFEVSRFFTGEKEQNETK